jgi:hypothetical protein
VLVEGSYRSSPARSVRLGQATEQARRARLEQDEDHPLPKADLTLAHVVHEGGQQEVLVPAAAPSEGVEDIQRVTLVLHHHGPEQPLLRWRQIIGDYLALGRVYAGRQSAQEAAHQVGGST